MKKLLAYALLLAGIYTAYAVVAPISSPQIGTSPSNGYVLQTNGTSSTWVATSSLGITGFPTANGFVQNSSSTFNLGTTSGVIFDRGGSVYNVKSFGAVGDGVTNDTNAIQNAFNTASSTCGTVYLPQGVYATTLLQLRNCVSIKGAGIGSTIIKPSAAIGNNPVFNYQTGMGSTSPLTDVTISDLEFDGSDVPVAPTSTFKKAIYIVYSERLILQNIYAHNFPSTCIGPDFMHGGIINNIYVSECGVPGTNPGHNGLGIGVGGQTDEPLLISNIQAWNNANNGVLLEYVPDTPTNPYTAHNILLNNIVSYGNARGFRVSGASNVSINNCSIHDNTDHGMYYQNFGSLSAPDEDIKITNCYIYDNGDSGVEMITYEPLNYNPIITNNHIFNNTNYGIYTGGNGANISNNVVYNNTKTGIYYYGNSNYDRSAVSINLNSVYDNGSSGVAGESDGIRVETLTNATSTIASLNLIGNHVFNQATTTQINGITIKNNIENANIIGNIVKDNITNQLQQVSIPATSTINIKSNIGINDNSSASTTPSIGSSGYVQFASSTSGFFDGVASFFWDKVNSRLGIGTAVPAVGLHYVQTIAGGTTTLKVQNNDTGGTQKAELLLSLSSTLTNSSVGASLLADRNNALSAGDTDLQFRNSRGTSMFTNMILKATGLLGIGTTTPTSMLSIQGTTTQNLLSIASSTGTNLFSILANGNVGVGTSSPSQKVDIWGNLQVGTSSTASLLVNPLIGRVGIGAVISVESSFTPVSLSNPQIYRNNTGDLNILSRSDGTAKDIVFRYGSSFTPSMTIKDGGNVGIGTTSPRSLLSIASSTATSTLYIGSGGFPGQIIMRDTGGGTTCTQITTTAGLVVSSAVTCP